MDDPIPFLLTAEAILTASPDAVIVHDMANVILHLNAEAERIYGWENDEVRGQEMTGVLYLDADERAEAVDQLLKEGAWCGRLQQVDSQGGEHIFKVKQTLLRDDSGQPLAILSFNAECSVRSDEVEPTNITAEPPTTQPVGDQFIHEMNNLLAPIMLSSAILQRSLPDEKSKKMAAVIEDCARKGSALVAGISGRS